jgi:hypothetical protein
MALSYQTVSKTLHQIISMFPYSDGRCAIFTKYSVCSYVFSAVYISRQNIMGKIFGAHLGFSLQVIRQLRF